MYWSEFLEFICSDFQLIDGFVVIMDAKDGEIINIECIDSSCYEICVRDNYIIKNLYNSVDCFMLEYI